MTRNPDSTDTPSTAVDTTPLAPTAAPGHYGPGYGDTAEHYGDDAALAGGTASTGAAPLSPTDAVSPAVGTAGSASERPDFTPDDVTARPPTESPSKDAPESENVGLTFERS